MATAKRKLNIALIAEEDKNFSLVAEKRLKEKGRKLTHDEVWGVNGKRVQK